MAVKLTKKGKSLMEANKEFSSLEIEEQKALILLNIGQQPSGFYYEDARKSLKKSGYIESK